jgi:lipid-binding SYLF domain-containing protein
MRTTLITILAVGCTIAPGVFAADKEAKVVDRLDASADLLTDMMRASDKGVPQDLMDKASCIVLVPGMKKGGFIVAAKYGRGFAFCRRASGKGWSAPAPIRVEGGSVGFQIGASEQDVMLLIMNEGAMKHLLESKFTIGGEATAAAGPLGRDVSAQTDASIRAQILSYSRSRGLFAGISLQGATLRPDDDASKELYGHEVTNKDILTGVTAAPASAAKVEALLNKISARMDK